MRVGRLAPTIVHNQRLRDPHASAVLSAARQAAWANGAFARVVLMSGEPVPAILSVAGAGRRSDRDRSETVTCARGPGRADAISGSARRAVPGQGRPAPSAGTTQRVVSNRAD